MFFKRSNGSFRETDRVTRFKLIKSGKNWLRAATSNLGLFKVVRGQVEELVVAEVSEETTATPSRTLLKGILATGAILGGAVVTTAAQADEADAKTATTSELGKDALAEADSVVIGTISVSDSQSMSASESEEASTSLSESASESVSESQSVSTSESEEASTSLSESVSVSVSESTSVSESVSESQSISASESEETSTSLSESVSESQSMSTSESEETSSSLSESVSESVSRSTTTSVSASSSESTTTSTSTSASYLGSMSQTRSQSESSSSSQKYRGSEGILPETGTATSTGMFAAGASALLAGIAALGRRKKKDEN